MNIFLKICLLFLFTQPLFSQEVVLKGALSDDTGETVAFANVVLYEAADSKMVKAEVSDLDGKFVLNGVIPGSYYVEFSFIGLEDKRIDLQLNEDKDFGMLVLKNSGIQLETTVVTAKRALVEVKADKTVFNVEGTINSAGDDVIGLLRKAPGVLLDNNNSITVLGRNGVLVYIDGKKLPLEGDDLVSYLESIPSEQIDRLDIITNPGAKYEAEGNAGIIDIRFKKSKNVGSNGTLSTALSQGEYFRYNVNASGNTRTEKLNAFTMLGYNDRESFNEISYRSQLNGLNKESIARTERNRIKFNGKLGLDYYLNENSTLGVIYSGSVSSQNNSSFNRVDISDLDFLDVIDSSLLSENQIEKDFDENTVNFNYTFNKKDVSLVFDVDYGAYNNEGKTYQPNVYSNEMGDTTSSNFTEYESPAEIDIYTAKLDFEMDLFGGRIGAGTKFSIVNTKNTFLFYDLNSAERSFVDFRSNHFEYDEKVYAAYLNYSTKINDKVNISAGLRTELTDAYGELTAYDPELQEPPVIIDHLDLFPSFGLSYAVNSNNSINLNYGRRINRPDYNVLNPFREQTSELSYWTGNPFMKPEIVNNYEIGYNLMSRYNFKLSYSHVSDQITRLISPSEEDPRVTFVSWDNLATKKVYAISSTLPFNFTNWWNSFFSVSGSYINNQADYGDGAIVDLQAWSYNFYTQQTFNLPMGLNLEVSGYYNGPGIWGGVFSYDPSFSLNVGVQKKFLAKNLNVKLSGEDLFYESGWSGTSYFNGLKGSGNGKWDSRRVSLSLSYKFGNNKIKNRTRKTGLEEASKRVAE